MTLGQLETLWVAMGIRSDFKIFFLAPCNVQHIFPVSVSVLKRRCRPPESQILAAQFVLQREGLLSRATVLPNPFPPHHGGLDADIFAIQTRGMRCGSSDPFDRLRR
jgi:hypothetical protein